MAASAATVSGSDSKFQTEAQCASLETQGVLLGVDSDDAIVEASHLSPSYHVPQSGAVASIARGNTVTYIQAFRALAFAMTAARPFVSFVMRRLQTTVRATLNKNGKDDNCFGSHQFDSGPMGPMRVTSLSVDGVFTVDQSSVGDQRGHCFEQYSPCRIHHPIAISFTGNVESLNRLDVSEGAKL